METKEGFILYKSFYGPIKTLTLEEKGQLLDAIFNYQINPDNPVGSLGSSVQMAFSFFVNQFRIDNLKYQKTVERNRNNGLKGGRPKNPVGFQKPKKADKDKDIDKATAIEELLLLKGAAASLEEGTLSINGKQINNPIAYLNQVKQSSPPPQPKNLSAKNFHYPTSEQIEEGQA